MALTFVKAAMNIYLVRVRKTDRGELWIERKENATTAEEFIAISHVWGTPSTITRTKVPGVDWEVALSPGKKDILSILSQPNICGFGWFWMDLFCIDQRDTAAIPISDQLASIPVIYKSATWVKVLIEHPVCREWRDTAVRVSLNADLEEDNFVEQERIHARRCQCMIYLDPWFERLWTRQEGLYARRLKIVVLNEVDCPRFSKMQQSGIEKWHRERSTILKRALADEFVKDKIRYHGIDGPGGYEAATFQIYLDLIYRGTLDIASYTGSCDGPCKEYSPMESAWRSGRTTTRARDYILAVLPDMTGYRVPKDPRRMTFDQLFLDALEQLSEMEDLLRECVKVNTGTAHPSTQAESSLRPVIAKDPSDITEAFDTFLAVPAGLTGPGMPPSGQFLRVGMSRLNVIAEGIIPQSVDLTMKGFPGLLSAWESSAAVIDQLINAAPSSPCQSPSHILVSAKDYLYRYFASTFGKTAIARYYSADQFRAFADEHGVVDLDKIPDLGEKDFEQYLRRFLACLVCGITLKTAERIVEHVEFCYIPYKEKKLLAIMNKEWVSDSSLNFVLAAGATPAIEGFHVAIRSVSDETGCIFGRTWVPRSLSRVKEGTKASGG